jgi:hypothetical protein
MPTSAQCAGSTISAGEAKRHSGTCVGGVGGVGGAAGAGVEAGADGEAEARAEGMGGAQQGAEIGGFRDALGADAEIAAGPGKGHGSGIFDGA